MEQPTTIMAIVTMHRASVEAGGVPIFFAKNNDEFQELSASLEKILDASAHEINPHVMIIVAH